MTYKPDAPYVPVVEYSRPRLVKYCTGQGLDLGCGIQRITPTAIGVDIQADVCAANVHFDLNKRLDFVARDSMDYVFSSHLLEHLEDPLKSLIDWWSKIRPGGTLCLVLPHQDHYPNEENPEHRWKFAPEGIIELMDRFATYELLHNETHTEDDEFSFELVFRKLATAKVDIDIPPRAKPDKKALVVRYGGIGDIIIATPVFRLLKEQGYHVTFNTNKTGMEVTRHNPHIDDYIFHPNDTVPNRHLPFYWERMAKGFDRFINLSGTMEDSLLLPPENPDYQLSHNERRIRFDGVSYIDNAMEKAGFPEAKGLRGELFFSPEEEIVANAFRRVLRDRFVVIWALSGSGPHKSYPYFMEAMDAFSRKHPETVFVTVGGYLERLMEIALEGPCYLPRSGVWDLRNSLAAVKVADLVIGGETGMLNAAGCFDVPKLCFLTHSSWTNLAKYWRNDYSVQSSAECSPCHRMIYNRDQCQVDPVYGCCTCMAEFPVEEILFRMKTVFNLWNRSRVKVPKKILLPSRGR